jgi:hypothetical protein
MKLSWTILRLYHDNCLEEQRSASRNLSQQCQVPDQDLDREARSGTANMSDSERQDYVILGLEEHSDIQQAVEWNRLSRNTDNSLPNYMTSLPNSFLS